MDRENKITMESEVIQIPIEWLEKNGYVPASYNPVHGCTPISEACARCWAKRLAETRLRGKAGYDIKDPFRVTMEWDKLDNLVTNKKPHSLFMVAMGDLFHPEVTESFIASVFSRVILNPQHLYWFLTKRPERMVNFVNKNYGNGFMHDYPNIWFGVTCENQERLIERFECLVRIHSPNTFISVEPMLGPVDISTYSDVIKWCIVGGESGPGCRPMDINWMRELMFQCKKANIPFYGKQLGGWPDQRERAKALLDGKLYKEIPEVKR